MSEQGDDLVMLFDKFVQYCKTYGHLEYYVKFLELSQELRKMIVSDTETCEWTHTEMCHYVYTGECGKGYRSDVWTENIADEENMIYCPKCGKRIVVKEAKE